MQQVTLQTDDGHTLSGLLIKPKQKTSAACVLHSATGIHKEFYIKFATWMAVHQNIAMLLYDYRDFGSSLNGHIKDSDVSMSDWGVKDQSAALDFLIGQYPETEIWAIGHSLGGLFFNAHKQSDKVKRAIGVASGANYWTQNPPQIIPLILALWWGLGPILTKIMGYLPAKALGLGADLPKNVFWEWRKWCLSKTFYTPDYGRELPAKADLKHPENVKLISIESDHIITAEMVKRMRGFYTGSNIEYRHLRLDEIGAKKIGHIDIFRERNKKAWPLIIQ